METYTITIVIQSAGGTYTRTLVFDTQEKAEKARAFLVQQTEKIGGP